MKAEIIKNMQLVIGSCGRELIRFSIKDGPQSLELSINKIRRNIFVASYDDGYWPVNDKNAQRQLVKFSAPAPA